MKYYVVCIFFLTVVHGILYASDKQEAMKLKVEKFQDVGIQCDLDKDRAALDNHVGLFQQQDIEDRLVGQVSDNITNLVISNASPSMFIEDRKNLMTDDVFNAGL